MSKWLAEFELEDGDIMPEHMDLEYKGARIDFHCRPLEQEPTTKNNLGVDCIDRKKLIDWINVWDITPIIKNPLLRHVQGMPSVTPQESFINKPCVSSGVCEHDKKIVLDKIRAEIEQLPISTCTETCRISINANDFKENVLVILDKYKDESGDKE